MKQLILLLISLFMLGEAWGGQGGFLGLVATEPKVNVANRQGSCMIGSEKIHMILDNYIERKTSISCVLKLSRGSFDLMLYGEKVASYEYSIFGTDGGNWIRNTYLHPDWTQATQFFGVKYAGRQHRYLVGLHNGPTSRWMSDRNADLHHLSLMDMVLPGSHDSGTYSINSRSEIGAA